MTAGDMPPAAREDVIWVDPLVWAREILKELKSRRLGDVAKQHTLLTLLTHHNLFEVVGTLHICFGIDTRAHQLSASSAS